MACYAPPYGLRYAGHCFNRAPAQQNRPALIPAGGKLGVTSGETPVPIRVQFHANCGGPCDAWDEAFSVGVRTFVRSDRACRSGRRLTWERAATASGGDG